MAASTIEGKIADLLLTRLGTLPFSPAYQIAMPNRPFKPPLLTVASGGAKVGDALTYLEARILTNNTVNLYYANSDPDMFQGILQITVVAPNGQGSVKASDIAGEIAADLKAAQITGDGITIKIEDRPSLAPMIQDKDRIRIPVSARYRVFA
jgi:hypothetical protein